MSRTYLKNVRIVDGTGAPAIENGLYVFDNIEDKFNEDVVEYVGEMDQSVLAKAGPEDAVFDLSGHTILPGLINCHVHLDLMLPYRGLGNSFDEFGIPYRTLLSYRRAAEALDCGVTTIRSAAIPDDIDIGLKKAINKNMLCGPNIIACGKGLVAHNGHGSEENSVVMCSGVDAFMKAAREQLAAGADQLKMMYTGGMASANEGLCDMQMTDEEVKAVVDVAHRAGKKCFAHLSNDKAIRQSVLLGVDSVEHGYTLSEETAKLMAEHGTYFVPTISVSSSDDYLLAHGCPAHQVEKGREAAKTHRQGVTWAHKHGVKICVGTDLLPSDPVDGTNATVREIELLVQCGLSPMEAIKAATSTGAELCGLQDVTGTLKPGLMGDFIVVEGKPDENISDLRKLRLVAKHCRLIWSTLPNLNVRRFSVLAPVYEMKGRTFCDWRLI